MSASSTAASPASKPRSPTSPDEIAYNNHDVDDGIRAGADRPDELREVALFRGARYDAVVAQYPDLREPRLVHEIIRRMINFIVIDLIRTTRGLWAMPAPPRSTTSAAFPSRWPASADPAREEQLELKQFLIERVYKHYKVLRMTSKARRVLKALFDAFFDDAKLMPTEHQDSRLNDWRPRLAHPGAPARWRTTSPE